MNTILGAYEHVVASRAAAFGAYYIGADKAWENYVYYARGAKFLRNFIVDHFVTVHRGPAIAGVIPIVLDGTGDNVPFAGGIQ